MENRSDFRQELGRTGEDIACGLLRSMGHVILERNWRSGHLEIDIISSDSDGIHFVEVKTRRDSIQAPPQENVGRDKQRKLTKAALKYLHSRKGHHPADAECMFDVVAVTFYGTEVKTEWFPQAFIPIYL